MRKMIGNRRAYPLKSVLYVILGLAMVLYAIPKLPAISLSVSGIFTVVWLLFSFLFIGANLYYVYGVDKEAKHEAEPAQRSQTEHQRKLLMHE
ncbi:hypothetical protein LSG31_11110 [Fodinisporobacter ferrooxydans]|uniref:Uncharacterized protein n=1 Tax=Fodinisporobacter ferrooxydans TaxID=2901836 RepID=A0ABY4CXN2_9BACL|nr:hypothetical protein LSG31_11110 [Alicyclobacillaceae bacterium MYW30-H2]